MGIGGNQKDRKLFDGGMRQRRQPPRPKIPTLVPTTHRIHSNRRLACRAVLASEGASRPLSTDHKPESRTERQRCGRTNSRTEGFLLLRHLDKSPSWCQWSWCWQTLLTNTYLRSWWLLFSV